MKENLLQFVEYIFPASKDDTRLWFLRHRDLHRPLASISSLRVNIYLLDNICMITNKSLTQLTRKPYESTAIDDCIPSIRKETRASTLSLQLMISESQEHRV